MAGWRVVRDGYMPRRMASPGMPPDQRRAWSGFHRKRAMRHVAVPEEPRAWSTVCHLLRIGDTATRSMRRVGIAVIEPSVCTAAVVCAQ
jgi:hypothetical protein